MTGKRLVARVAQLVSGDCDYEYAGHSPGSGVVLLEELGAGGDVLTFRYTNHGMGVGEIWYVGIDEARAGINAEFPEGLGEWAPVPADIKDAHEFAAAMAMEVRPAVKPNVR